MSNFNKTISFVIIVLLITVTFTQSAFATGEVFRIYGGSADWGFNLLIVLTGAIQIDISNLIMKC